MNQNPFVRNKYILPFNADKCILLFSFHFHPFGLFTEFEIHFKELCISSFTRAANMWQNLAKQLVKKNLNQCACIPCLNKLRNLLSH